MEKDILRIAISIIIGYVVVWYIGAMFNFFPFYADDLSIRAIGFTGLIICLVIVGCACWIIHETKKK
ncbi:MAG TPA: hypothetical protein DCZ91_24240 [Lachnospiraceae bacterium]|nr:hypothetical protein [Lachnospiraceae bacterium]